MMKRFWLIMALFVTLAPLQALATTYNDLHAATYDTTWYDRLAQACATGNGTQLQGNDNVEKAFRFLTGPGHDLTPIEAAGIIGNLLEESGLNPNNGENGTKFTLPVAGVGFGIAQWTTADRQAGLEAESATEKLPIVDLGVQLNYLWHELTTSYAPSLAALKGQTTVDAAATSFMNTFEHPRSDVAHLDVRIKDAEDTLNLAQQKGWTAGTAGNPTSGCSSVLSEANGNIVQTAIGLAWCSPTCVNQQTRQLAPPPGTAHNPYTPTDAYRQAWDKASDYTDCGAFVATVMITSGVDRDYPKVSTAVQQPYVLSHPQEYQVVKDHNTGALHPGDILVFNNGAEGHTMIYMGPNSTVAGGFVVIDASLGDHTPQLNTPGDLQWMLTQPNLTIVTPLGAK